MIQIISIISLFAWLVWSLVKLCHVIKSKMNETRKRIDKNACDIYDLQQSIRNLTEVKK